MVSPELHSSPDRTVGGQDLTLLLVHAGGSDADDKDGDASVDGGNLIILHCNWDGCAN